MLAALRGWQGIHARVGVAPGLIPIMSSVGRGDDWLGFCRHCGHLDRPPAQQHPSPPRAPGTAACCLGLSALSPPEAPQVLLSSELSPSPALASPAPQSARQLCRPEDPLCTGEGRVQTL